MSSALYHDKNIILNKIKFLDTLKGLNITCRGSDHVRSNVECEDYSDFGLFDHKMPIQAVFTIADGHSSDKYSRYGAEYAIQSINDIVYKLNDSNLSEIQIIDFFSSLQGKREILNLWKKKVVNHAVANHLIEEISSNADIQQKAINEYGATLLFVIVLKQHIIVSSLGDGYISLVTKTGETIYKFMADEEVGDQVSSSLSHMNPHLFNLKIFSKKFFSAVILTSDGISKPNKKSMNDFSLWAKDEMMKNDVTTINNDFLDSLISLQAQVGDDISLVVGVF